MLSTLVLGRTLDRMDTQSPRVTREEAAKLAGVLPRQINRWSAAGLLTPEYDPQFRRPATYDRAEVEAAAELMRGRRKRKNETDIASP